MKKNITGWYNFGFIIYLIFAGTCESLFKDPGNKVTLLDKIFPTHPYWKILFGGCVAILVTGIGVIFIREFWNRFISDVFKLRLISSAEALAIILTLTLFYSA